MRRCSLHPSCSNSPAARQAGFTLIEVVVAVSIAAILLTTIYGVFAGVSDVQKRIEDDSAIYHRARVIFDRFGRELRGTYYREGSKTVFAGGRDSGERPFLLLSTTAVTPYGGSRGGIASVRYWVDDDPRKEGDLALFRNEWNAFEDEPEREGGRLLGGIEEFQLRFFGFNGWKDDWEEAIGSPPRAVEIKLVLKDGSERIPFQTFWELPGSVQAGS